MNSVVAGSRSAALSRDVGRVDVGDVPAADPGVAVRLQRLVRHHRPEIRPADADVDHGA